MTEDLSAISNSLTQLLETEQETHEMIRVEQQFDSINSIRQAAIRYARRNKFAVSTLRSGARQLVLVCRHSGEYRGLKQKEMMDPRLIESMNFEEPMNPMQFVQSPSDGKIEVQLQDVQPPKKHTRKKRSQKIQCPFEIRAKPFAGRWIIYKINYEHNHDMAENITAYAQHRKMSAETKQLIIDLMKEGHSNASVLEVLLRQGIENVLKKDIANVRQAHFNGKNKNYKQEELRIAPACL